MDIIHWIIKNLKLDDNNKLDLRFAVVTLCVWSIFLTLFGAIIYALMDLWELCSILACCCLFQVFLYFYCRNNTRFAYIATYVSLSFVCVLIHFVTTYYLGNCGTVFFVVATLIAPHMYPLLSRQMLFVVDLVLMFLINLTFSVGFFVAPIYPEAVKFPFRFVLSNFGLLSVMYMLYVHTCSQDFIEATRQSRIEEASKEVVLDALTNLGNRRMLEQHRHELEQTVTDEHPLCVAILDIDYFKKINDTYGHAAGDKILLFVAHKMQASFRKGDLLIRWGGEEFLLFLRRTAIKDAVILMENFRRGMQGTTANIDGVSITVHVTIGIKEHPPGVSLEDTLIRADELMYQGKLRGRNCVTWENK